MGNDGQQRGDARKRREPALQRLCPRCGGAIHVQPHAQCVQCHWPADVRVGDTVPYRVQA